MNNTKKTKRPAVRALIAACLALVIAAGAGGGLYFYQANAVASIVSLDINPSIELQVNSKEKVLSCKALNNDAADVLADMNGGADLEGTKLDVAVNAIIGALLRQGYLQSISDAILISVEDEDSARAAQLQRELTSTVDAALSSSSAGAAVLSQTLAYDSSLTEQARASGISTGKAALVEQAISLNSSLQFDALAALSVDELRDLIEAGAPAMPIGRDAALSAALSYAGLSAQDVYYEIDSEIDERTPHYEVELNTSYGEFDYQIDAYTGEVLRGTQNVATPGNTNTGSTGSTGSTGNTGSTNTGSTTDIGEDAALNAALTDAGLSASQVTVKKLQRDWDDGRLEYEVEFYTADTEYDYTIDGASGAIRSRETEAFRGAANTGSTGSTGSTNTTGNTAATTDIGEDAALNAALTDAGLTASQVTVKKLQRDWDDGRLEYEVEFYTADTEYDYTIDGASGAVRSRESETFRTSSNTGSTDSSDIGESAALTAALNHAGLSEGQVTVKKIERDWDDGRLEYEIEFYSGRLEYEYTIDGATGSVLEYERDD